MARALPDSLFELSHLPGVIRVQCRKCGREARFSPGELSRWFRARRIRDDWKTIRRRFVCQGMAEGEGCGGRDVEVTYELTAPEPPKPPPAPRADCPPGIDPQAWARADHYQRKRLIRQARN